MKNHTIQSILRHFRCLLPIVVAALLAPALSAQVAITSLTDTYEANFAVPFEVSPPATQVWEDDVTIPGWYARVNNEPASVYTNTNGSAWSGIVAYNPTQSPLAGRVAHGVGSLTDVTNASTLLGVRLRNETGVTLTEASIDLTVVQYYGGNAAANDTFTASYNVGGGDFTFAPELDIDGFVNGGGNLGANGANDVIIEL